MAKLLQYSTIIMPGGEEELIATLDDLQDTEDKLNHKIDTNVKILDDKIDRNTDLLNNRIDETNNTVAILDKKVDDNTNMLNDRINVTNNNLTKLESKVDNHKSELDRKTDTTNKNLDSLKSTVASNKSDADSKINSANNKINNLEKNKSDISHTHTSFNSTVTFGRSAEIKKQVGSSTQTILDNNGRIWRAVYNDLAELMHKEDADEDIQPGDVVVIGSNGGMTKTNKNCDPMAVGVYSDTYGFCLGGSEDTDSIEESLKLFVPVGISGRVRVKIEGKASKGDLLVSSSKPGFAVSMTDYMPGTVIGKAMEDSDTTEDGRIWALIMAC